MNLGQFYQFRPNKTNHVLGEKSCGGKNSKVRLTGMAASSVIGKKLEMFLIGKSATPQCFRHIKNTSYRHHHQKKSRMSS